MPFDINFMIGGEAGQGVQSVGAILAKALARGGFQVFADQDYESRVRGGHSLFRVRASEKETRAFSETVNILIAFTEKALIYIGKNLNSKGVVVFDNSKVKGIAGDTNLFGVPLERLAQESAKNKLMANTVGLGAAPGLTGYDIRILNDVIEERFGTSDAGKATAGGIHPL